MSLWPVAAVTFKEGIRNKAIYGISVFALLMLGASLLISGMIMQEVGKVMVDMALSTVSLSGLLLVLFVGINLMAKDLDKRTIYMVLSRPISRSQYLFGKFLGMVLLIVATIALVSLFALAAIALTKLRFPDYFLHFSWGLIFLSIALTTLSLILLSALSFLFASVTSTSFITLVLTIISYLIGHGINDVKALVEAPQAVGIQVAPSTVKLVQGAYYLFPNLSLFDIKIQAAHGLSVPLSTIGWTVAYGLGYTAMVMILASLIFSKREFP
ncbi:ABC-2 family transporter protein XapB [Desulfuromonas soudanensis]|uniref:ABC-2 family transporter protein XapB n=1 Tax=Desulfuromonas soudanensis TaxID=1603606 RepID=A0A0M4DIV6_9BACT|nr:ABC transporter permease [Desulfuromonas soudanensis]ALC16920.1 ABC-2 family transporter protein XapB [Desulfuromonas soudanensis]